MNALTETDAAYIAGIIDGEGYIGLIKERSKNTQAGFRYVPRMSVSITSEELVDFLVERTAAIKSKPKLVPGHQQVYMASWESNKIRALLPQVFPHLIIKRHRADVMLCYLQLFGYRGSKPLTAEDLATKDEYHAFFKENNMRGGRPEIEVAA